MSDDESLIFYFIKNRTFVLFLINRFFFLIYV